MHTGHVQFKKQGLTPTWLLAAAVLLVYANSWSNPFILDDVTHLLQDPRIGEWKNWTEVFRSPFFEFKEAGLAQYYRPLTRLTYKAEWLFFGGLPFGYHLVNTAFHLLNTLLLYLICRRLAGRGPAFLAALIFGIHPLQAEEVSYISGLGGVASVSGILASLYCFIRFLKNRRFVWYLSSLLFFLIGLLYKEVALLGPVLLAWLVLTAIPSGGEETLPRGTAVWFVLPFFLLAGGYLILRVFFLIRADFTAGLADGLWLRFLTFGKGIWIYLGLALFPFRLHFYRSLEVLSHGWHVLPLLLLGGGAAGLLRSVRRPGRPFSLFAFGFGWFLIGLLPFSGINPIYLEREFLYWAEHFMYLPLAGLGIALAAAFTGRGKGLPAVTARVCLVLIVCVLALLTVRQNEFWSDETVFFERMSRHEPDLFRTASLLGIAYYKEGRIDEAIAADLRARALLFARNPVSSGKDLLPMERYQLKIILWRLSQGCRSARRYDEARQAARELLEISPDGYEGRYLLGRAFLESGDGAEALPFLEEAYRLRPDDYEVARALILCCRQRGDQARAREVWSEASRRIPAFSKAREILKQRYEK
ncbi:MAG: tetratricopeptide repeat protein [PVC group bacterium]